MGVLATPLIRSKSSEKSDDMTTAIKVALKEYTICYRLARFLIELFLKGCNDAPRWSRTLDTWVSHLETTRTENPAVGQTGQPIAGVGDSH